VSRVDGILAVSDDGEKLIKQAFGVKNPSKFEDITEMLSGTTGAIIAQLERKDKQIAELTATVKELSKTIKTLTTPKPKRTKKPMKKGEMSPPIKRHVHKK